MCAYFPSEAVFPSPNWPTFRGVARLIPQVRCARGRARTDLPLNTEALSTTTPAVMPFEAEYLPKCLLTIPQPKSEPSLAFQSSAALSMPSKTWSPKCAGAWPPPQRNGTYHTTSYEAGSREGSRRKRMAGTIRTSRLSKTLNSSLGSMYGSPTVTNLRTPAFLTKPTKSFERTITNLAQQEGGHANIWPGIRVFYPLCQNKTKGHSTAGSTRA
ncbi:hypothetical protein B0T24DRAFT_644172 [Lasiosphaeria ovina]|uniref:Uncharacterized protein n=1 Tax=Lasiosphaeria ovina TaxID=92902 RepID=A0AAE0JS18_9PEZI|nr:hypothetical protein B0T24DRAFT_644172 [Lasiosphaeria ovina]